MNEQELADLFSEQLDRMFQGEPASVSAEAGEVQELLTMFGQPAAHHQFQAGAGAQTAFQNQLTNWFGLANGGSPMTILGLSKAWFISIIVTTVIIITGAGLIAVATTSYFIFGPVSVVPASPTAEETATDTPEETATPDPSETATDAPDETTTPVASTTPDDADDPDASPTADASETPETPAPDMPPLVFIGNPQVPVLCQGVYATQSTLVNFGSIPIDDASLVWQVIEGAEWVDGVIPTSPDLDNPDDSDEDASNQDDDSQGDNSNEASDENTDVDPSLIVISTDPLIVGSYTNFLPVPVEQKIKLDVKVKVKDNWWGAKKGSKIKVKLSIDQKFGDNSRFKYKYKAHYKTRGPGQIITIVKQDAKWKNLRGVAHPLGNQKYRVDGVTVVTNSCTGLPLTLPAGAFVNVIGWLQPNGTFLAINMNVVNITIINGDFNSGVPLPNGDDDDDDGDGGSGGGGGGGGGGGKGGGGKGGSRGGS